MNGEEREFRIYVESRGAEPVVEHICGLDNLSLALAVVQAWFPKETVYIREVTENVFGVFSPPHPGTNIPFRE